MPPETLTMRIEHEKRTTNYVVGGETDVGTSHFQRSNDLSLVLLSSCLIQNDVLDFIG